MPRKLVACRGSPPPTPTRTQKHFALIRPPQPPCPSFPPPTPPHPSPPRPPAPPAAPPQGSAAIKSLSAHHKGPQAIQPDGHVAYTGLRGMRLAELRNPQTGAVDRRILFTGARARMVVVVVVVDERPRPAPPIPSHPPCHACLCV